MFGELVVVAVVTAAQASALAQGATFAKDIAPIVHRSCVNCHRPGSIAPMSLVTYDDVRPCRPHDVADGARQGDDQRWQADHGYARSGSGEDS